MRSCATGSPILKWASCYLKCMFSFSAGHCRWMCGRWASCCTRCCLGADPLGRGAVRRRFCATRSCSRPSMSPSLQSLPSLQNARTSSHGKLARPRTGTVTALCPAQSLYKARWERPTILGGTQPRGNSAKRVILKAKHVTLPAKAAIPVECKDFIPR